MISIDMIKKLRQETGAGIADCRQALEDAKGLYEAAKKLLQERGLEKAKKKEGKETAEGIITAYVHATRKVGVLLELRCETDFVARTEDFQNLAKEICLQIAAMNPKDVSGLLSSEYIRDSKQTIESLVKSMIAKVGENITITRFTRMEVGE
ncbi:MAG: translation elongation factor Ts [Patescibacteria group bacterium]|nr:translation elongation factor Ts [Patescibacteria group bacterium]